MRNALHSLLRRAFIVLIVILLSAPVEALAVRECFTDIVIDEAGQASVTARITLDSRGVESIRIPVKNPEALTVYDNYGTLEYSVENGLAVIKPGKEEPVYSVTANYVTDTLTTKNGEEWSFSYSVPEIEKEGYGLIESFMIDAMLPSGVSLESLSEGGTLRAEGNNIIISWDFGNVPEDKAVSVSAKYSRVSGKGKEIGSSYAPFLGAMIVLLAWYAANRRKQSAQTASHGREDILKTLSENEERAARALIERSPRTQKELMTVLGMSKSTLSRTLRRLEQKKIVELKDLGSTNRVTLTEWFAKK